MSVASGSLAGLEELWGERRPRARGAFIGTAVALGLHVAVAAALVRVDTAALLRGDTTVEMEVEEPPPPPPDVRPEPPEPPPPPEAKPRIVMRHAPTPPPEAPPPSEEPPKANEAPPVFGVSLDSTVGGDGPGLAVPVGNTLMTKPRKPAPAAPLPASTGDPDRLPAPVPEILISEMPVATTVIKAPYPPEAQRMGMEGHVRARLYIDDSGDVRRVTIIEKLGHGFDEAARDALKKFKFSPARTSDGKAVPTTIVYTYTFEQPQ